MRREDALARAIKALRHRLSRFSAASRRSNASLDFETLLPGVPDSARPLTDARHGLSTLLDDGARRLREMSEGVRLFQTLSRLPAPLRRPGPQPRVAVGLPPFADSNTGS